MNILGMRHPFMRPLWRRIAVLVVCFGWALFELYSGAALWAGVFGVIGVLALWEYVIVFDPENYRDEPEK